MKRLLLLTLSLFAGLSIYASSERTISEEALERFVESKLRMAAEMAELNLPVTSSYMKSSMKAEAFSVDLTGLDRLVLLTTGGEDGSGWDHAVWAEARLIRKDGTSVWLDEIPYAYGKAGEGDILYNKNQDDGPIAVAGKRYGHLRNCGKPQENSRFFVKKGTVFLEIVSYYDRIRMLHFYRTDEL